MASDARRPAQGARPARVLVLGETARADHFSLLGYERDTNPQLAQLDVVAFTDVTACGTSTAQSLPCMFSARPRTDFDRRQTSHEENLLDVLQRVGVSVL